MSLCPIAGAPSCSVRCLKLSAVAVLIFCIWPNNVAVELVSDTTVTDSGVFGGVAKVNKNSIIQRKTIAGFVNFQSLYGVIGVGDGLPIFSQLLPDRMKR